MKDTEKNKTNSPEELAELEKLNRQREAQGLRTKF